MERPTPLDRARVEHSVEDVIAMGSMLSKPRWARIWHSVNILSGESGAATAAEVIDETGIPQTTVYDDLSELVDLGALKKVGTNDSGATRYREKSGHVFVSDGDPNLDDDYLHPPFIGIVGRAYENEDVELFIKRNGYNVLYDCSLVASGLMTEDQSESLSDILFELDAVDAQLIESVVKEVRTELAENTLWDGPTNTE